MYQTTTEKSQELYTVHKVFKSLSTCSAVSLRDQLSNIYSELWAETGNDVRSDEKRIKRILDKLVDFGIANRQKVGKEYIYQYSHVSQPIEKLHKLAEKIIDSNNALQSNYAKRSSMISLLNQMSETYYIQSREENIEKKEDIIIEIENAIENTEIITITYHNKKQTVVPLNIVQLDGYWYLVAYRTKYFTYRIRDIIFITNTNELYDSDLHDTLDFDAWHNSFHSPKTQETIVTIHINKKMIHYFKEKNILGINTYTQRCTPTTDGMEYEVHITHVWELLPTLMQWQKFINILSQNGEIDFIKEYKNILENTLKKLPT